MGMAWRPNIAIRGGSFLLLSFVFSLAERKKENK
jgi:hypothetical protein